MHVLLMNCVSQLRGDLGGVQQGSSFKAFLCFTSTHRWITRDGNWGVAEHRHVPDTSPAMSSSKRLKVASRWGPGIVKSANRRSARQKQRMQNKKGDTSESDGSSEVSARHSPCIFELGAPVLFTAPHGIPLWRDGKDGKKRQKHLREYWATEIALRLSKHVSRTFGVPASFMIWDTKHARSYDSRNLDPNFLSRHQFPHSPWHQALETFSSYGNDLKVPIFHVDIHGKKDRKTDLALDVGFGGLKAFCQDKKLVNAMVTDLEDSFTSILNPVGVVKNGLPFSVDIDPEMSGFWKDCSVYTMSSQSAMLGIPSVQLEIPKTMRQKLFEDDNFLAQFGDCILHVYEQVICKDKIKPQEWYTTHCRSPATDIDAIMMDMEKQRQQKRELNI